MDYKRDVSIDFNNLDKEWLKQPSLTLEYGEVLADARLRLDKMKEVFDITKAEIDISTRGFWSESGKKFTEAQIAAEVLLNKKVRKASEELMKAREDLGSIQVAYDAIQTKKSALENLVKLHGQDWFSRPVEPRETGGTGFTDRMNSALKERSNEAAKEAARRRRTS